MSNRPVIVVDASGRFTRPLVAGDTPVAMGGTPVSVACGLATLNFGLTPTVEAQVSVTGQTGLKASSYVLAWVPMKSTADNSLTDHQVAGTFLSLTVGSLIAGTGFTIYANSIGWMATGQFTVHWMWN